MRAEQYACFAIYSSELPAAEITQQLGVEPDTRLNEDSDRGEGSGLEITVEQLLDDVQDSVARATRDYAWPPSRTYPEQPLPVEWAEVRSDELHFGYTESDVEFPPISLDDIPR